MLWFVIGNRSLSMKIPYGFLCALLGSSILIACGGEGGGGGSSASDTTKPTITATTPAQGATNTPINTPITVTFSEPMDPASISNTTFSLTANGGNYPGSVIYTGTTAIFTPNTFPLAYASNYTATVSNGAKDLAGNSLAANHTWSFTTIASPDTTRPTIISTSPVTGATNVSINPTITVTFSEPMDPSTISASTIYTLEGGGYFPVISYSGTTATFTPTMGSFAYSKNYNLVVSSGVKDLAGNSLAADYTLSFTTTAPAISTSHQVNISWAANREAAVNRTGGGYKVAIIGQPVIDIPYPSLTNAVLTLMSGNYTGTVTAYSAINPSTGLAGSSSSPPTSFFISVP
jgi:methionine-rich copper-binding protein CopC